MTHPDPHSRYSHHYTSFHRQGDPIYYREVPPLAPKRQPSSVPPRSRSSRRRAAPAQPQPTRPAQPQPTRRQKVRRRPRSRNNVLLAGGSMLALAALVVVPKPMSEDAKPASDFCQERVQSQSVLSRAELSQLLAVPERSSKESIRQMIEEPYCNLSPLAVREGAIAEREAYPLEFDPQTWLIVLYEEGEYAGYDFSFHRE